MLNELYELANALKKANIATRDWHKNFKLLPKGGGFIFKVFIDKKARVTDLIVEQSSPSLRKWEKANGFSFPSFNVSPLIQVKAKTKELLDLLKDHKRSKVLELAKNGKFDWRKESSRINECLQKVSEELATKIGLNMPNEMSGLKELIQRADLISKTSKKGKAGHEECVFLEQLRDVLIEKVTDATINPEKLSELLFVSKEKEKSTPKLNILLELSDSSRFPYPANHPKIQEWVNERLLADTTRSDESDLKQKDAFGNAGIGEDKMPPTKIAVLGKVTLRSMSSESPCQQRYGRADAASYPIGEQTRKSLKAALETITRNEWKEKTWTSFGGKEMLIVYPFSLPALPPPFVGMFGGTQKENQPQEGRFSSAAQEVAQAYKTGTPAEIDNVAVFLLKKPDGYRTKVANGGIYKARYILDRAVAWEVASQNIPFIRIKSWDSDKKPVWRTSKTPFPLEVITCLNTQWLKFGHGATELVRYEAYDGIELFLSDGERKRQIASKMLMEGLRKWAPLLLGLGQACHQGEILKGPSAWQWRLIPPALGIFLKKLGLRKETYMLEAAYLVGQTLGLADSLHHQYCLKVRKQSVPPQLMGNGLMATALENPRKALALLARRILPYQAWARTYNGQDAGLSKWFLRKFSETSTSLAQVSWPERMGDADKAQMLLGYLAGFQKEDEAQEKTI